MTGSQERALAGGWYHVGWLQSHAKLPAAPTSELEEHERQQAAWVRGRASSTVCILFVKKLPGRAFAVSRWAAAWEAGSHHQETRSCNPKTHIPSSLMTIYLRCRYCYYGLFHLSQSDLGLLNPAAISKPHQQEYCTLSIFNQNLKLTKASSNVACFPHAGGFIGIMLPLSLVLQSSCGPYSVTSHVLFAICYSASGLLCKITTFSQLTNPRGLLMKVLPDREHEGMKKKEWSIYREPWSSCKSLKQNTQKRRKLASHSEGRAW